MRRRSFDLMLSMGGLLMAAALLIAGILAFAGYRFADGNVTRELTAQRIFFPPQEALTDPRIEPYLSQYAGQQLVTGEQAEAYAKHFIGVHLQDVADGKTYAEVSSAAQADPENPALQAQRDVLFRGETLRGLLLNTFAFWKLGQLAMYGSYVAFALAGILAILAMLGFRHARRTSEDQEVFVRSARSIAA